MERSGSRALQLQLVCFFVLLLAPPAASSSSAVAPTHKVSWPLTGGISASFDLLHSELRCGSCTASCKLDNNSFAACNKDTFHTSIFNGRLGFEIWVHASSGFKASEKFNLAADQKTTTAYIDAGPAFTNAVNLTVKIFFSAPCVGGGGFKCASPSICDLIVTGAGVVVPSTLKSVQGGLIFILTVALQTESSTGKVMLALAKGLCTDAARNSIEVGSSAIVTIHFDRRPIAVNLWTAISDTLVQINNVARTVQATNKVTDLIVYLDFTHPVSNTSEELVNALRASSGILKGTHRKSHGNRRFGFELTNVKSVAVITVSLDTGRITSRAGTVVRQPPAVTFLYDSARPEVKLTTTSSTMTRKRDVPVLIEFTKPVFPFDSQALSILDGQITSFQEVSKSIYAMHVLADEEKIVTIFVTENKTADIAGNLNLPSNVIRVRHYIIPAVSIALYSFTTASLLATSFAAGIMSVSSASLAAAGALTAATVGSIVSDPSRNLLGMAGHLQVFALSQWLTVSLPIEYYETTRGLQWLVPHARLPWERQDIIQSRKFALCRHLQDWHHESRNELFSSEKMDCQYAVVLDKVPVLEAQRGRRLSANASVYGPPLSASEYGSYFQAQSLDLSSQVNNFGLNTYTGWRDFKSNMFWLGTIGGAVIFLHFCILGFLRWRTRTPLRGSLLLPRFELFLLIFALPGLCQALAFIIRGGTTSGIVVGVILLAVPVGFLLSVVLFLCVAVFVGKFVQYYEIRWQTDTDSLHKRALQHIVGVKSTGTWTCKEGLSSTFLWRFGLLFEDRKGPRKLVILDSQNPRSLPRWIDSGSNGIGRMKVASSNDDSEEAVVSRAERIMGVGRASYIVLDLARRASLGLVFGVYNPSDFSWSQVGIVFGFTVGQLLFLVVFRPYIRRGVQIVETVSLLCEAAMFAAGLTLLADAPSVENRESVGMIMLALLLISLVVQLVNEWYALMNQLLRLSPSQEPSLKLGVKMLYRGLLLPFIPRERWSRFISALPVQPKTGLVTVIQSSPELDLKPGLTSQGDPDVAMTSEAVVQAYGPGSPCFIDPRTPSVVAMDSASEEITAEPMQGQPWNQWNVPRAMEGKRSRGTAKSSELKTLRELAKASFPRGRREEKLVDVSTATGSFEPMSGIASPSSLLVEQQTPSRAGGVFVAGAYSEDSSSADDLEVSERELPALQPVATMAPSFEKLTVVQSVLQDISWAE